MKTPKSSRVSFIWYITIIIVLLIGIGGAIYAGMMSSRNIKKSLLERTESIAALIPAQSITSLKAHESDVELPAYQQLKTDLMDVRGVNHDIRFIYILGINKNDEVFFHVDSESPKSED